MKNNADKILILNYEYPPLGGGGGVATRDLAIELAKHAQVDVITSSFRGLKKFETVDNVNIYRVRVLLRKSRDAASFISLLTYLPGAFIAGIKLIRKNRYHVINTQFVVPSGPIGFLLGKIFKIPNILSLHGGDIYDPSKKMSPHKSRLFSAIVRFLLNWADVIAAQSTNTRDNAIKYYKPEKNIQIIPLPFNIPVIHKVSRKELDLNKSDFILSTCGRLVKRKSIDVLINALAEIPDEKYKLLVMGDGPEKENLINLARDLKIEKRVIFLGFINDENKYRYLSVSDVFTLTSMHEGFGIVYMEAMYCGLPIICSNHGGQVDFLKHKENAMIINPGDYRTCADFIIELNSNKKLYNKISKNNKIKVKDFNSAKIADSYFKVFKEAVSGENFGN